MASFGLTSAAAIPSPARSVHADPMLAARWISRQARSGPPRGVAEGVLRPIDRLYTRMLELVDDAPLGDRARVRRVVASTVPIFKTARRELRARRGRVTVPGVGAPAGRLEPRGDAVAARPIAREIFAKAAWDLRHPGIAGFGGSAGSPYQGTVFTRLTPAGTRPSQQALWIRARAHRALPEARGRVGAGPAAIIGVGGRGAQTIQYALVGPDLAKLDQYTSRRSRSSTRRRPWSTPTELCSGAARAARRHRSARGRPGDPRAGRLADGQRA